MSKYITGIVLYNPDLPRLEENVKAIYPQCEQVVMVDNHSCNIVDVDSRWENDEKIKIIHNNDNKGIAKALNQLAEYAYDSGYEWLLTLDQDSVSPEDLIQHYELYTDRNDVGIICCKIKDRNFGEKSTEMAHEHGWEYIPQCITSASMLKLEAWKKVGGFCDKMFIDGVDFDLCYSLGEIGYKIIRTNDIAILHEVGHSRLVKFIGREEQIYNHSALRYYYMVRNSFLLGQRHHLLFRFCIKNIKLFVLVLAYEEDKAKKSKMMIKGFYHALIGRYGRL